MKNEVLIIGKIPPPIGGVTTHVVRLIEDLKRKNFESFLFVNLARKPLWKIFLAIPKYEVIHLHTSNPYLQLITALHCFLMGSKLITTYHGNWGRYGLVKNLVTKFSSSLASVVVVMNASSLKKAQEWNKNSILLSSFILPNNVVPFCNDVQQKLAAYTSKYPYVFCTNAWDLTFDKNGREIYGISDLVSVFQRASKSCLIISDPSGNYKGFLDKKIEHIPENILLITSTHDFCNVLQMSDVFIRNTTTDGDSISIHEALFYKVIVLASDCVPRPQGCRLYNSIFDLDLEKELEIAASKGKAYSHLERNYNTTESLIKIYKELIINKSCI